MRNATLDILHRKTTQLEAMVAMLSGVAGAAYAELTDAERGNYAWVMADLVADIKSALDAKTGASHG
ncbi:hypothetical protein LGM14_02650 [Burkholderia multivorans]|uniref:hypothetical protein n=1 Tax=Burkholderia multivorans TaxID=87883 RepID=UPI00123AFF6A|nr:hypothetical protein [Burkholderia multivorans]MCA7956400.1 hypothetical protein [Burkholderia multivorans]MDN7593314.1 hypothetical protein [Burkholderia multivorans]QET29527.1 hypothetical protein FOB31_06770 [Burkholderia multivorans]QET39903.1 hypothetical protein FOB30_19610 [Burkholderia multivorans]